MIDCPNVAVRDALPEYLHDVLDPEHAAEIRAHLDNCSACTEELSVIQVAMATAPRVSAIDTAKIVAAIPAYRSHVQMANESATRPVLRLESNTSTPVAPVMRATRQKQTVFNSAKWRMAAGFLVAAIGVSALSVTRHHGAVIGGEPQATAVSPGTALPSNMSPGSSATSSQVASTSSSTTADDGEQGLAIVGVSGLTDDQLAQFTRDLDHVEATPSDEPESEVPAAIDVPGPGDGEL